MRDGRLGRNPAAGVDLPRLPTTDRRYLTRAQLADLAEHCGPHRLLVLVLGYTGLRWARRPRCGCGGSTSCGAASRWSSR